MKTSKRSSDMDKQKRLLLAAGLVLLLCAPTAALAQYPPQIGLCAHLVGSAVVQVQGTIQIEGGANCAEANGLVAVDAQSHRFNLHPGFRARPDGSYTSPLLTLPAHMRPGPHRLIAVVENRGEVVLPILVVGPGADMTGGGGGGGGGALRTVSGRGGGGGGGGGALPKTGAGIAMLILWALALIALGTALVYATKRGRIRLQPLRVVSSRLKRRDTGPLALPAPDVPYIDTTGFVPTRPLRPIDPGTTEADVHRSPSGWDD